MRIISMIILLTSLLTSYSYAVDKQNVETENRSVAEITAEFTLKLLSAIPENSVIAVIPFTDKTTSDAATAVSESVVSHILAAKKYTVVDRSKLDKTIEEVTLSQTGMTERELEMGKMLAADYIITGDISDAFGKRLISSSATKIETNETVSAVQMVVSSSNLDAISKEILSEKGSPMSYAARSILLPGWGQIYGNRNIRGGIFMAGCVGALGFTIYSYIDADSKNTDWYNMVHLPDNNLEYEAWLDENDLQRGAEANELLLKEAATLEDEYNTTYDRAVLMTGITAGAWVINIIDAYIVGRSESERVNGYFTAIPIDRGMKVAFNF